MSYATNTPGRTHHLANITLDLDPEGYPNYFRPAPPTPHEFTDWPAVGTWRLGREKIVCAEVLWRFWSIPPETQEGVFGLPLVSEIAARKAVEIYTKRVAQSHQVKAQYNHTLEYPPEDMDYDIEGLHPRIYGNQRAVEKWLYLRSKELVCQFVYGMLFLEERLGEIPGIVGPRPVPSHLLRLKKMENYIAPLSECLKRARKLKEDGDIYFRQRAPALAAWKYLHAMVALAPWYPLEWYQPRFEAKLCGLSDMVFALIHNLILCSQSLGLGAPGLVLTRSMVNHPFTTNWQAAKVSHLYARCRTIWVTEQASQGTALTGQQRDSVIKLVTNAENQRDSFLCFPLESPAHPCEGGDFTLKDIVNAATLLNDYGEVPQATQPPSLLGNLIFVNQDRNLHLRAHDHEDIRSVRIDRKVSDDGETKMERTFRHLPKKRNPHSTPDFAAEVRKPFTGKTKSEMGKDHTAGSFQAEMEENLGTKSATVSAKYPLGNRLYQEDTATWGPVEEATAVFATAPPKETGEISRIQDTGDVASTKLEGAPRLGVSSSSEAVNLRTSATAADFGTKAKTRLSSTIGQDTTSPSSSYPAFSVQRSETSNLTPDLTETEATLTGPKLIHAVMWDVSPAQWKVWATKQANEFAGQPKGEAWNQLAIAMSDVQTKEEAARCLLEHIDFIEEELMLPASSPVTMMGIILEGGWPADDEMITHSSRQPAIRMERKNRPRMIPSHIVTVRRQAVSDVVRTNRLQKINVTELMRSMLRSHPRSGETSPPGATRPLTPLSEGAPSSSQWSGYRVDTRLPTAISTPPTRSRDSEESVCMSAGDNRIQITAELATGQVVETDEQRWQLLQVANDILDTKIRDDSDNALRLGLGYLASSSDSRSGTDGDGKDSSDEGSTIDSYREEHRLSRPAPGSKEALEGELRLLEVCINKEWEDQRESFALRTQKMRSSKADERFRMESVVRLHRLAKEVGRIRRELVARSVRHGLRS